MSDIRLYFHADYVVPNGPAFKAGQAFPWHPHLHLARKLCAEGILQPGKPEKPAKPVKPPKPAAAPAVAPAEDNKESTNGS